MTRPDLPHAAVVIAAAGSGARLGGDTKQFRFLGDKPLLIQTSLVFERHPQIDAIAIAVPAGEVDDVTEMCRRDHLSKVVSIVPGGATRQDSVRVALRSLPPEPAFVLTHDAVRPFVSVEDVDELLATLLRHEAATLATPVTDTLCRSVAGMASERVDRAGVFRLLTPQAFRRDVLERGHGEAAARSEHYTDEVTMVRALGVEVALVPCSTPNIKITTGADWSQAEMMWPGWIARKNK